jgi:hypothetical protein
VPLLPWKRHRRRGPGSYATKKLPRTLHRAAISTDPWYDFLITGMTDDRTDRRVAALVLKGRLLQIDNCWQRTAVSKTLTQDGHSDSESKGDSDEFFCIKIIPL